jgi:hypothetical protein
LVIRWLYQSYQFIETGKFCIETVTCLQPKPISKF